MIHWTFDLGLSLLCAFQMISVGTIFGSKKQRTIHRVALKSGHSFNASSSMRTWQLQDITRGPWIFLCGCPDSVAFIFVFNTEVSQVGYSTSSPNALWWPSYGLSKTVARRWGDIIHLGEPAKKHSHEIHIHGDYARDYSSFLIKTRLVFLLCQTCRSLSR